MSSGITSARVSIVMRTYERTTMLARAIASVQNQTFADWHLIIVNNGGRPGAVEDVVRVARQATAGGVIEVLHLGERHGMEEASNRGLAATKSEYFVIHDDDDSWKPGFLERAVAELDANPDAAAVVTGVTRVVETVRGSKILPVAHEDFYLDQGRLTYRGLIGNNMFPPIAALFRRSVLDEVGMFDASLPVLGDWEFNLRAVNAGRFVFVEERLANYHTRTADSDAGAGNSITTGQDLHRAVKVQLQNRWLAEPAINGVNKGMLSITSSVALDMEEMKNRMAVRAELAVSQARRSSFIGRNARRVLRGLRSPRQGWRAAVRIVRRKTGW